MYYLDSKGNLVESNTSKKNNNLKINDNGMYYYDEPKKQIQQNNESSLGEKAFNVLKNINPAAKVADLGIKAYNFIKEGDYSSIVKKPEAFNDGYDFGDITKTYYGTGADLGLNYIQGIAQTGEGIGDLLSYGYAGIQSALGNKEKAEQIKRDAIDNAIAETFNYIKGQTGIDKYSVAGQKTQEIVQGLGNASLMYATAGLGNAAGLGTKGTTALTSALTGTSSMGSGMSEAYSEGATDSQAVTYGIINGVAEAGSELLFGGLGKGTNAIGISQSAIELDDQVAKRVSKLFKSQLGKNISEYGVKAGFEGLEEVISGAVQGIGKWLTYKSDENLLDILNDENLLEQFIMGATISGIMQTPGFIKNTKAGKDFVTGYTQDEQATIDSEVQRRIDQQQKDGKKLSTKEINDIRENVEQQFNDIQQAKAMNIEDFRNNASSLFQNLSESDRVLYNNLINDISQFMYVTNSNIKFDESLQSLYQWDGGTLVINPTMTDTPIKTIILKEYTDNIFSDKTSESIIKYAKEKGIYDSFKKQLEGRENIEKEIESYTLNYILDDAKRINEVLTKNKEDFNNFKDTIKALNDTITTNRNTKDASFIKELNNKLQFAGEREELENEFRRVQEESRRIPNEEQQLYRRGEKRVDEKIRGRLSNVFGRILESRSNEFGYGDELHLESKKNGTTFDMYQNVDGKTFHDIFEISRNYLTNGELVDLHSAEDYNETENYMASDGLSGFAITKDGDLISVFNLNDKKGFLYAISDIVKEKAKTLDCYMSEKQPLSEIYEKVFGFKIASVMEYNMEYDHDDIAKNHNMPKVAFMVNTDEDVMTRRFNKDQYDEAYNYRQSYLEEQKPAQSSNKVVEGNDLYNELNENKQIIRTTNNLLSLLNKEVTPRYGMSTQLQNKGKNPAMYGQQTIKFKPEILNYVDKMYKGDGATNRGGTRAENPNQFNTIEESMADNSKIYNEMLIKGNVPIADMIEEVRIPDNSSDELINKLDELGIKYTTYKPAPSYNQTKEVKTEEKGTAQRKTYTSIIESPNQSEKAKEIAREKMGTDTYVPDSNEKELKRADEYIEKYGVDKSLETLKQNTESTRNNVDDVVIGERLMQYFAKTGEADKLDEAIQLTAMAGTNVGRAVQAMAMINRQTPQGQATWIQRSVDKMNKQMQEAYNKSKNPFKKLQQFDFTAEMKEKIINSTEENLEDNLNEVYAELGKQVKMSSMEKLDAWRYFAMLSSPTTHIRNMFGNFAMGKMQRFKNRIAGGIQDIYYGVTGKEGERTATFFKANKKIRDFCKNDIQNVEGELGLGDDKYTNPKTQLQKNMRMFSDTKAGRFLENTIKKGLIDTTSNTLAKEDVWGLKAAYVENMSQYLYANKIDIENITDEQLAKARRYAIQQAKEATFHQDSDLATLLNTFENKNLATKLIVGGIIPFKKTPFNVAKTALSYNPVSFLKTFTYDTVKLVNGQLSANQYIDNIAKGLTGTGIALLGYALASMGFVRTTGDDDEDYEKDSGKQPYSLVIGDKSITLDWLSPTAVPFFTGAEMFNVLNKLDTDLPEGEQLDKRIDRIAEMGDAFLSTLNPVSEMTMLEGITDALKSYSQGSAKWLEEIGANTIKTYVNQFVPSIQGKVAKRYDEYERSTSTTSKTVLGKTIESIKNQTISKIPGLRKTLPIKTDVWGNEIKTVGNDIENPLLKTIVKKSYNFLSPSNIKDIRETQLDKEIKRLYESTGEKSVIPKTYIDKYFTYDNKEYRLNSNEYEAYKATLGKNNYEILSNLIKSNDYKKLNDEEKAKVISQVYSYDKAVNKDAYAKIHNIKYTPSNTYNAQKKSIALGGKIEDYIMYNLQEFKADKDANGNAISGTAKRKVINYLNNSNMDYNQKLYLLGKDYALTNQEKSYLAYLIYNSNLTREEKIDMYNDLTGFKVDKYGNVRW